MEKHRYCRKNSKKRHTKKQGLFRKEFLANKGRDQD
jgi:hypothetical protein